MTKLYLNKNINNKKMVKLFAIVEQETFHHKIKDTLTKRITFKQLKEFCSDVWVSESQQDLTFLYSFAVLKLN